MNRIKLLKYGKWIAGVAAAASLSGVVSHCSNSQDSGWTPSKPTCVPDNYSKWDYNWDKREPYSLVNPSKISNGNANCPGESIAEQFEKVKAKATRHLILVRHGQYNLDGKCDATRYLTPLGTEQAQLTGCRLRALGIKFDSIVTSSMKRAMETGDIILKQLCRPDLFIDTRDPMLEEGAPCLPEPSPSIWKPDCNYYEDGPRIEAAFRKYFHRADPCQEMDTYEVIVCHGNVIRYFVCRALQVPPEAWLRINLNHSSLTHISISPSGRVSLNGLGESGHIPADKITS